MDSKLLVIFKRFARGFAATAIPIAATELAKGYNLSDPTDLKRFILSIITPVIAGLLLAGEKLYRWQEPEQPIPVNDSKSTKASKS